MSAPEVRFTGPDENGEFWLHLEHPDGACGINLGQPFNENVRAALEAAVRGTFDLAQQQAVEVVPLRWDEHDPSYMTAEGMSQQYVIYETLSQGWVCAVRIDGQVRDANTLAYNVTLEAAKAAAQADHERRILSFVRTRSVDDVLEQAAQVALSIDADVFNSRYETSFNRKRYDTAGVIRCTNKALNIQAEDACEAIRALKYNSSPQELKAPADPKPELDRDAVVDVIARALGRYTPGEMMFAGDSFHTEEYAIADALISAGYITVSPNKITGEGKVVFTGLGAAPFDPVLSPGHTDLLVDLDTLDEFMEAHPLPEEPSQDEAMKQLIAAADRIYNLFWLFETSEQHDAMRELEAALAALKGGSDG